MDVSRASSHHCLPLSKTSSLTNSSGWNLNDVTLVDEGVYLMVSNLFTKEMDSNAWYIMISTILVQMFPSQHFINLSQKNLEEGMSYFVRGEVGLLFRSQFDNWNHRVYSASGSIMFTFTSSFCREKSSSNFQAVAYFSLSSSLSLNFLSISN